MGRCGEEELSRGKDRNGRWEEEEKQDIEEKKEVEKEEEESGVGGKEAKWGREGGAGEGERGDEE